MGQRDAWGRAVVTLLTWESGLLLFVTPLQAHTTYFAKKFEERGQFSHYFFSILRVNGNVIPIYCSNSRKNSIKL